MSTLSEFYDDGLDPVALDERAQRLAITTAFSYDEALDQIRRFTAAMNAVAKVYADLPDVLRNLVLDMDAPRRRSVMHAAYRAKTRRRNRR